MEKAVRTRVRCAWAKFKDLSPILTIIKNTEKGQLFCHLGYLLPVYGYTKISLKIASLHMQKNNRLPIICGKKIKIRMS